MAHRSEVQPWTPRSEADSTPVGPDVVIKSSPNFPKVAIKEANAVFAIKEIIFHLLLTNQRALFQHSLTTPCL